MENQEPERWVKARRAAAEITDHGMDRALRSYFRVWLPVGTLLLVGAGFTASAVFFAEGGEPWFLHLALGFMLAAIGTMVGGFVYAQRRIKPKVETARTTPLLWLEKSEQQAVQRQMLGKSPPTPEHLAVTRGVAVETKFQLARQLASFPAMAYLCLAQLLTASESLGGFGVYVWVPLFLLSLGIVGYGAWQYRQIAAFLRDTRSSAIVMALIRFPQLVLADFPHLRRLG